MPVVGSRRPRIFRSLLQPRSDARGHGDARICAAVERALATGAACSYENELQTELAELVCATVPSCERVRFIGSGTEATMHTIRLAWAYTGRPKLLKIEGNFHGYHDQVMFSIGTPADRLGPEPSPTAWPGSTGIAPGWPNNWSGPVQSTRSAGRGTSPPRA